jgi:hypothetical protein
VAPIDEARAPWELLGRRCWSLHGGHSDRAVRQPGRSIERNGETSPKRS